MCGVIGYVGPGATPQFFFNGLKRLEYRGYDSAGIAMLGKDGICVERAEGKLLNLEKKLKDLPETTVIGIGHTRWATHGRPTENNAHPHRSGVITLLHNGIIENYRPLKEKLVKLGYKFLSETDTEVAAHLINYEYSQLPKTISAFERMQTAIFKCVKELRGAYAFAIICTDSPDTLYAVKLGSPMVIGQGDGENYLASGITALVEHTRQIYIMEDNQVAFLKADSIDFFDFEQKKVSIKPIKVDWSVAMMEKGGYRHYMLKEIHDHPQAVANGLLGRIERDLGRVSLKDFGIDSLKLKDVDRVQIIACGSSYYAGLTAKYLIERVAKIPVEIDLASEYRYKASTVNTKTLSIAVSQSGETADTLQAIKYARENGAQTLALVNVPGSSIGYACHAQSQLQAGPEIGVASTKVFTSQILSLMLVGLSIAQEKQSVPQKQISEILDELFKIPSLIENCLGLSNQIEAMTQRYLNLTSMLFIGRGPMWPIALEGALKIKELSYIHAEGYAGGELKHGPIALIDENMTTVCLVPQDEYKEKTISNIEEIKARGGRILAIGTAGDPELKHLASDIIEIPACSPVISPFLMTIPIHLFAYWLAVRKGTDVDQPRNLAKSVTVE